MRICKVIPIFFFLIFGLPFFVLAQAPVDVLRTVYEEATNAFGNQEYQKAITLFEKTLEIYPDFAPSYNFLGLCYKESGGDIKQIFWYFNKAIEKDPNYALAYDNLGKMYYSQGEFLRAEKYELIAIEKDPTLVTARLTLGWIYLLGMSRTKDAIKQFKISADEYNVSYAYFGLGMAYFMDGQSAKALDMITLLRQNNREDLASNLEAMVRDKQYVSSMKSPALILRNKEDNVLPDDKKIIEENKKELQNISGIKVRLRGYLP